jgi:hypothetical protein
MRHSVPTSGGTALTLAARRRSVRWAAITLLMFLVPPSQVDAESINLGEQPAGVESGGLLIAQEVDVAILLQDLSREPEDLRFGIDSDSVGQPSVTSTVPDLFYGDFYSPPADNTRVTPGGRSWWDYLDKIITTPWEPRIDERGGATGIRASSGHSSDSYAYAMVPEPAGFVLVGTGLCALGLWRWRRIRKKG